MDSKFLLSLVRRRLEHAATLNGFTAGEAAIFAEQRIANEGLTKLTGKLKLQGTPEAGIATMCESYWILVYRQIRANPVCEELEPKSQLKIQLLQYFGFNAIREIEGHRSRFHSVSGQPPQTLQQYIAWRMDGEMRLIHGIGIESFGYTDDFLKKTCEHCSKHLQTALLSH